MVFLLTLTFKSITLNACSASLVKDQTENVNFFSKTEICIKR